MSRGSDILICVWITLCAAAFWGPYIGFVLAPGLANALYAAFLLSIIGIVLIRWLKSRTEAEKAAKSDQRGEGGNGGSER